MKKIASLLSVLLLGLYAQAQTTDNEVIYFQPRTVIKLTVSAEIKTYTAGPYAKYSQAFLGVNAPQQSFSKIDITNVELSTGTEADPQRAYTLTMSSNNVPSYLTMTSQGLIAAKEGTLDLSTWSFSTDKTSSFNHGMVTKPSQTRYVRNEGFTKTIVTKKTTEQRAKEVADKILEIRDYRYKIIVGDTDATYSGEALKTAVTELTAMEEEYMALFTGVTYTRSCSSTFYVIPDPEKGLDYVAFRASADEGILPADAAGGTEWHLVLDPVKVNMPEPMPKKGKAPTQYIEYRIPAVCTITLTDGETELLTSRAAIFQMGTDSRHPLYN